MQTLLPCLDKRDTKTCGNDKLVQTFMFLKDVYDAFAGLVKCNLKGQISNAENKFTVWYFYGYVLLLKLLLMFLDIAESTHRVDHSQNVIISSCEQVLPAKKIMNIYSLTSE